MSEQSVSVLIEQQQMDIPQIIGSFVFDVLAREPVRTENAVDAESTSQVCGAKETQYMTRNPVEFRSGVGNDAPMDKDVDLDTSIDTDAVWDKD